MSDSNERPSWGGPGLRADLEAALREALTRQGLKDTVQYSARDLATDLLPFIEQETERAAKALRVDGKA